ncbi:MAG: DUF4926 domain-containing protein [Methylococcaceae bacterium]
MKILEVVALTNDISEKHLRRGQVGTVLEVLAPGVVEVEFADLEGIPYVLHHMPDAIAA